MAKQPQTKAVPAEPRQLSVAEIDIIRAHTMNELDLATARLNEAAFAAALPDGDEGAMLTARDAVHILELKLQGLAAARKQAEEVEARELEVRNAAARREDAVKIRIGFREYAGLMSAISAGIYELKQLCAQANAHGDLLRSRVLWRAEGDRQIVQAQSALVLAGAFGEGNVPFLLSNALEKAPDMRGSMIGGFDAACRSLSAILPDILAPEVIAECDRILDQRAVAMFAEQADANIAKGEEAKRNLAEMRSKQQQG